MHILLIVIILVAALAAFIAARPSRFEVSRSAVQILGAQHTRCKRVLIAGRDGARVRAVIEAMSAASKPPTP